MPAIFAPQAAVANDTGAVTLGFQGAPNVLYDRTMVGNTTYTLDTAGTTGGETMAITLRGLYAYSFASAVPINWAGGTAPTPECSVSVFDRIKFEVLQDGSLLGIVQAMGASAPVVAPAHYLNVAAANQNASINGNNTNDGSDSFISIQEWLSFISSYTPSSYSGLVGRWYGPNANFTNSEYIFGLSDIGELQFNWFDSEHNGFSVNSSAALTPELANAAGLWIRVDFNGGTTTVNGVQPGTAIFYTASGGPNPQWTQLGSQIAGSQTGLNHNGSGSNIQIGDQGTSGWATTVCHIYEVLIQNSETVLANPKFYEKPTTASGGSFVDNATTPNTIILNTNIV